MDLGSEKKELRVAFQPGKHCVHRELEELGRPSWMAPLGRNWCRLVVGITWVWHWGWYSAYAGPRDLRKFELAHWRGSGALLRGRPGAFGSRSSSSSPPEDRKTRRQHTHRP